MYGTGMNLLTARMKAPIAKATSANSNPPDRSTSKPGCTAPAAWVSSPFPVELLSATTAPALERTRRMASMLAKEASVAVNCSMVDNNPLSLLPGANVSLVEISHRGSL